MSKFHIYKDEQQQGPFTLDELRDLKITRETMVWFEGEDNWKAAVEIEELKEIFKSIPPPMVATKNEDKTKPVSEAKSLWKNNGIILVVLAVLLNSGLGYYIFTSQQAKEVEMLRQIKEQKIKIQELADIEAARLLKEQAEKQRQELEALKYEYNQAITNLRAAEIKLNEIQKFQLLRTPSEKEQQIQEQLGYIRSWENEVDRLKKEIYKF
jgi:hypothetical protein